MLLSGTNIEHTRSFNRRVVLEAVRRHGPISRAEIARLTSLTAQTVSNIASELQAGGLIRSGGRRRTGRGQPPVELSINPEGGYTVGLQLDHRRLSGVLVDLAGEVRERSAAEIGRAAPDIALPLMAKTVETLLRRADVTRGRVLGTGVVMPGPFDVDSLTSVGPTTLPGWRGVEPAALLSKATGLPVLVENDATAAALGERLYGAARHLRTFFYLYVGVGLGAGLILDGVPYRGAWGNAGEFGHFVVAPGGRACFCGNAGCLERYASLHSAIETVREAGCGAETIDDLAALAADGHPAMERWIETAAHHLRLALNAVENLLDPEAVLIGGAMPQAIARALVERLEPLMPSVSARHGREGPRLIMATAGVEATALGAAALPIFDTMSPSFSLLFKAGNGATAAESPAAVVAAPMTPDQRRIVEQAAGSAVTRLWDSLVPLTSVNRFLQTGAHPDDETSRLLARLAKADGVRLGFACGVRGEGGQNDIGTESRAVLGVLRTREMERAAEVLDMELFWLNQDLEGPIFDFGLSKTAEETFGHWGRERTVERLVRAIRAFRPDVVAPTFLDVPGQHGHHRAITRATGEAFRLAADPDAFPEHARDGLAPWQTAKLYLPAWSGAGGAYDDTEPPPNATITVPVGGFDPVHGATYAQIAQWSRAFHRTQGMGHWVEEGEDAVPLHRLACAIDAPDAETGLFDGLPRTLGELADRMAAPDVAEAMRAAHDRIDEALAAFPDNAAVLSAVHGALGAVRQSLQGLASAGGADRALAAHRLELKDRQLCHASRCAALLTARMECGRPVVAAGDEADLTLTAYLGGPVPLGDLSLNIAAPRGWRAEETAHTAGALRPGERSTVVVRLSVPEDAAEYDPYQFQTLPHGANDRVHGLVRYTVDGVPVETVVQPDAPLAVLPAVAAGAQPSAVAYNLNRAWPISVSVTAERNGQADGTGATLALSAPPGWQVSPDVAPFALADAGEMETARFSVAPPEDLAPGRYALPVTVDGLPGRAARTVRHPHIRATHVVTPAEVTVQAMSVALPEGLRIGYVDGGADRVHGWLAQLGCEVTLLDADTLSSGDLRRFDTIVIGIFAYKARPDLLAANGRLKDWVAAGGNLVTQYHRPWDNWDPETVPPRYLRIGQPSLRWRVTDEAAAVTPLAPDHPLLNHPNTITEADWQGWVKERGLYFAADWAPDYTPLLSMADPGEDPLTGSLLSAPVGKGRHTHTSLILYYQMDFLVPGAFRLMANLVTPPSSG